MENLITIREARSESEQNAFFAQLYAYFQRDILACCSAEERDYYFGDEYRATLNALHERQENRLHYLLFVRNRVNIGFAMAVVFDSEDGKCFIMEFCVDPEYRGGTGTACANALFDWSKRRGAEYWELNCADERRIRFWQRLGFVSNGLDENGEPLMLRIPEIAPITIVNCAEDWQLRRLENSFLNAIGEEIMDNERFSRLLSAIRGHKIQFFFAKSGLQIVGMCSVARSFSTFTCEDVGIFDDFFILPAFRKRGIARMLVSAARDWSAENDLAVLNVSCAPCDEAMYAALGFSIQLGTQLSTAPFKE